MAFFEVVALCWDMLRDVEMVETFKSVRTACLSLRTRLDITFGAFLSGNYSRALSPRWTAETTTGGGDSRWVSIANPPNQGIEARAIACY